MRTAAKSGLILGILTAALWSPALYLAVGAAEASGGEAGAPPLFMLTFHFYVVLWAALACFGLLLLSGRAGELSLFKRSQTHMLILVAVGGYGFWLLRALALRPAASGPVGSGPLPSQVHAFLYLGPLLLGFLSIPSREGARARQLAALVLGFLGCVLIARSLWRDGGGGSQWHGHVWLAGASAACWAVFALLARPAVREHKPLPVLTIVLGIGAACLLVTCLTTGAGVLGVGGRALRASMLVGAFSGALGLLFWLNCLAVAPPATAAPAWYMAMVFGLLWARWGRGVRPTWVALVGGALVVLSLYVTYTGARRGGPGAADFSL